jgi:hypothetical protein
MSDQHRGPPSWLFTSNSNYNSSSNDDTMSKKTSSAKAAETVMTDAPPPELMDMVETFLSEHAPTAHAAFKQHRAKNGHQNKKRLGHSRHHSLVSIFQTWETSLSGSEGKAEIKSNAEKVLDVSSTSDSDSGSDSDSDDGADVNMADVGEETTSSESSSSEEGGSDRVSESDSDEGVPAAAVPTPQTRAAPAANTLKRKAPEVDSTSEESDSDSDESSSDTSSEDEKPQSKKQKTVTQTDSNVDSSSESESGDDDNDDSSSVESESEEKATFKMDVESADDIDDGSSSESESGSSGSDSESEAEVAAKIPLPESDSSSDSTSDSDSDSDSDGEKAGEANGAAVLNNLHDPSDSSVTLDKTSPEFQAASKFPALPPDPSEFRLNNRGKGGKGDREQKQNIPFSRIPKDVKIDPRLQSNAYVPYDYAQKAHEDLIVTKGKGFTKEKNKKKRGSYRGGPIDVHGKGGIKFED